MNCGIVVSIMKEGYKFGVTDLVLLFPFCCLFVFGVVVSFAN